MFTFSTLFSNCVKSLVWLMILECGLKYQARYCLKMSTKSLRYPLVGNIALLCWRPAVLSITTHQRKVRLHRGTSILVKKIYGPRVDMTGIGNFATPCLCFGDECKLSVLNCVRNWLISHLHWPIDFDMHPGIILGMGLANERRRYVVTGSHWMNPYPEWSRRTDRPMFQPA